MTGTTNLVEIKSWEMDIWGPILYWTRCSSQSVSHHPRQNLSKYGTFRAFLTDFGVGDDCPIVTNIWSNIVDNEFTPKNSHHSDTIIGWIWLQTSSGRHAVSRVFFIFAAATMASQYRGKHYQLGWSMPPGIFYIFYMHDIWICKKLVNYCKLHT